jgi:ankyrin repeat protein
VNLADHDGDTPLHICEQPEVALFLLANGANESALNSEGLSVYQQAVELDNDLMVEFWANRLGITLTPQTETIDESGEQEWEQEEEGNDAEEGDASAADMA